MVNLRQTVMQPYRDAGALNAQFSPFGFEDEHIWLDKAGNLGIALQVRGVDYECLDHSQLNLYARRFEAALRSFPERFRLYQYILKRDHAAIPHEKYGIPVVDTAIQNRMAYLSGKAAELYELDIVFVVLYDGWRATSTNLERAKRFVREPWVALHEAFSTNKKITVMSDELDRAKETLMNKVDSFVIQLQDSFDISTMSKDRAFRFLRRLVNFEAWKADSVNLRTDHFIDYFACDSQLECHRDHLRLDGYYVQVLTMKSPPAQTFPNMLRDVQELPSNCIVVTEWRREDNQNMRKQVNSRRRHHFNSKASMTNYIGNQAPHPEQMLIDDGAAAHVRDLGACLTELEVNGNYFGQFSMTVVLYDSNRSQLQRSVAECFKVFSVHDAVVIEERYNLLNAFLATIPGNSQYNLRYLWLLNTNYADLSFLFTLHTGEKRNAHLEAEYLAVMETNHGTPYYLNMHFQDTAHTLILGKTGSGKSFFVNFLLTNMQKYAPLTYIFDLGGSYEHLTKLCGGSYLRVGISNFSFTINPFCLPLTRENHHFLASFVRVLIESGGYQLTSVDERDVYEQIGNLYEVEPDQRRLYTLANILKRHLRLHLQKWVEGGQYGSLFDNVEDTLTFARFQTFDFEGMDRYPQVLEPLLFYILHRADASINNPDLGTTFKAFVMDEAWRFLKNETIKNYITEAVKTWRKKNAAMILATQSSDDLRRSAMQHVLIESCTTKMFLANPDMDRAAYREAFNLNYTEAELIARLIPKQQILIKRPDIAKVVNLHVDRVGYWLYTNSPRENHRRREAFEQYGFEAGLEVLARS